MSFSGEWTLMHTKLFSQTTNAIMVYYIRRLGTILLNWPFHPIFLADPWSTQDNYGRQRCMHTMSLEQMTTSQKCLFIQMFWTWQSLCNFSNILYTYKIVLYCCLTMAIFIFLVHQHRSRNFGNWSFTQFFLLHLMLICFWFWPKCWRQSSSYMNKANDIQSV